MLRRLCIGLATVLFFCGPASAPAQNQSGGIYNPQVQTPNIPKFPTDNPDDTHPFHEYSRQRAREKERQRRIVDDANRLVKLTAQFRSDVEQHGSVTPEDEKLLMQIEKLAREVKDRMRGM